MTAQPGVQRQPSILIVDDEAAVGRSLQTFLAGSLRNVHVVVETDPQTALNRLLSGDIQLVIADQVMDGLTASG